MSTQPRGNCTVNAAVLQALGQWSLDAAQDQALQTLSSSSSARSRLLHARNSVDDDSARHAATVLTKESGLPSNSDSHGDGGRLAFPVYMSCASTFRMSINRDPAISLWVPCGA